MVEKIEANKVLRQHALDIFQAGLEAVDPVESIFRHVKVSEDVLEVGSQRLVLSDYEKIIVVGGGKAGALMGRSLERLLGDRIADGVIVTKQGHGMPLKTVRLYEAGHPVPDQKGVEGAEELLSLVQAAGARDLVFCLISGGGSALMVSPAAGITLEDKQAVTRLLLACGADIHEINTIRKHLSRIKGGGLAGSAYPATVVNLILSDVVGDDLNVIASGPTVPDTSTFSDAHRICRKYGIWNQVPAPVKKRLEAGLQGDIPETPKAGDRIFKENYSQLVGTNMHALAAAGVKARELGYTAMILSSTIEGEAREAAKVLAGVAREVRASGNPIAPPACILCGGETTVTIRGQGKGGRNQEFALSAAGAIENLDDVAILAGGTDGNDGPTDAAGAIVDGRTLARAAELKLDPQDHLERNDAYHFFQPLQDLLMTGPTGTNVMDVYMAIVS
jgi:hydroxypyruvate reductase